jgi:selenocysteine-specific elongation factor
VHVLATAGHVDHGKSTLVRALTGMEPDRWEEERRRGLSIGLGFAWTRLQDRVVALVDVPGHERFVSTMLAGVGPVPAVLFVVAADGGWMPQSAEHLAILDALGVARGLLVITRADLADPEPAAAAARARLAGTSLRDLATVALSAHTGEGLDELERQLLAVTDALPPPDREADVRLWVDRSFVVDGAGTVATGTLAAGTITVGDELLLGDRAVHVRGLHTLGEPVATVPALARVAVNLRGVPRRALGRGDVLLTPDRWPQVEHLDVALVRPGPDPLPARLMLHIGSASVPVQVRPLGADAARLRLSHALPLRPGDRIVLRDPGRHDLVWGADVVDVLPPALRRRGDAVRRAQALAALRTGADPATFHLRQHGLLTETTLRTMGLRPPGSPWVGRWYADPEHVAALAARARSEVAAWTAADPLRTGLTLSALAARLGLPDPALAPAVCATAGLSVVGGEARAIERPALPAAVETAVRGVVSELQSDPFAAPTAERLRELGLGGPQLAAAVRAGMLVRVAEGVYLLPGADVAAARILAGLGRGFTPGEARQALGTSRRVVMPLLELLDRRGMSRRQADGTRVVVAGQIPAAPDQGG